MTMS